MRVKPISLICPVALFLILGACTQQPGDLSDKVLLAIFAHPDDEATVSPVLARYAGEGVKVYLAVATDGRLGVTDHAKIPAGDSLAGVRAGELACATEKLGINPPIMFGLHDQMKMGEGFGAWNDQVNTLRAKVNELFQSLQPDVVITWGPSGWTSHHDHRIVGAVVTEVFQSKEWDRPAQLYYAALPAGSLPPQSPIPLASVDKKFLPVKISVSQENYSQAKESWLCHKSQYTPEVIDQFHALLVSAQNGTAYFQPLLPVRGEPVSLF